MRFLVLWYWNKGRVTSWNALIAKLIWEPKAKRFCLALDDFRRDSFGEHDRIWKWDIQLSFIMGDHLPFLFRRWQDLGLGSRALFYYILSKCQEFRVLLKIKSMHMIQDSLLSAVPTLRLRNWGSILFRTRDTVFLFVAASRMSPGSLCSVDTCYLSSGVKRPVIKFSPNKIPLLKSNQCTCCVNPN
jgi:hypothetical protein